MPCCKAEEFGNWCEGEKTYMYKGEEYCVFHLPAESPDKPEPEDFNQMVFERIDQTGQDEACNLSGVIFPGDISFEKYNEENPLPEINFISATFRGDADFRSATFRGDADFISATFRGYAYFRSATFRGYAYFSSATFSGDADFSSVRFSGATLFVAATFRGDAYFKLAFFEGATVLSEAKFSGNSDFTKALLASADLRLADFGEAIFDGCDLRGTVREATRLNRKEQLRKVLLDGFEGFVFAEDEASHGDEKTSILNERQKKLFGPPDKLKYSNLKLILPTTTYGPPELGKLMLVFSALFDSVRLAFAAPNREEIDEHLWRTLDPKLADIQKDPYAMQLVSVQRGSLEADLNVITAIAAIVSTVLGMPLIWSKAAKEWATAKKTRNDDRRAEELHQSDMRTKKADADLKELELVQKQQEANQAVVKIGGEERYSLCDAASNQALPEPACQEVKGLIVGQIPELKTDEILDDRTNLLVMLTRNCVQELTTIIKARGGQVFIDGKEITFMADGYQALDETPADDHEE